jgi:hypothetical protein
VGAPIAGDAFGIKPRSADTIVAELQDLAVARFEPSRARAAFQHAPVAGYRDVNFAWAFVLEDTGVARG